MGEQTDALETFRDAIYEDCPFCGTEKLITRMPGHVWGAHNEEIRRCADANGGVRTDE